MLAGPRRRIRLKKTIWQTARNWSLEDWSNWVESIETVVQSLTTSAHAPLSQIANADPRHGGRGPQLLLASRKSSTRGSLLVSACSGHSAQGSSMLTSVQSAGESQMSSGRPSSMQPTHTAKHMSRLAPLTRMASPNLSCFMDQRRHTSQRSNSAHRLKVRIGR